MSRKFLLDKFIVQESQKNVDKATDESEKNSCEKNSLCTKFQELGGFSLL